MSRRFELWEYAHDGNGAPVEGATLEFFEGGTSFTTPKDVYSNSTLTTPIAAGDLESNAAGRWPDIFMDSALYDVRATIGNVILTRSNYDPGLGAGFGVSSVVGVAQGGTGANNAASARSNLGAASSSSLTSVQDDVTALEASIQPGLNGDDELGTIAALNTIARSNLAASFGNIVVQSVDATPYTANTGLTTDIPLDDTTPLVSEGDEILTATITPTSASNKVRIYVDGFGNPDGSNSYLIWTIFRNSTLVYVKAAGTNSTLVSIATDVIDSPATTSQITYSVRVGSPGSTTIKMNGNQAGRLFNGTAKCTMRLEEIQVI